MSGLEIAAGAAVIGTGMSIMGSLSEGEARMEAAKQNAALKENQINEMFGRLQINEQIMRDQADQTSSHMGAQFAATGREGAGLGAKMRLQRDTDANILNMRRDIGFKANLLRQQSSIDTNFAEDAQKASYLKAGGTLLTSAGNFAKPSA